MVAGSTAPRAAEVGEPAGWQGPDGVIHFVARYNRRVWHAYSTDNGQTYTKLAEQPGFTDSPANKEFGPLGENGAWYVGNPYPNDDRAYASVCHQRERLGLRQRLEGPLGKMAGPQPARPLHPATTIPRACFTTAASTYCTVRITGSVSS